LTQARLAAEMMQQSIDRQMENMRTLSSELATAGVGSEEADIFIGRFLKENNHTREIFILNVDGGEAGRYSRGRSYFDAKPVDYSHLEQFEKAKAGETYFSHVNYPNLRSRISSSRCR